MGHLAKVVEKQRYSTEILFENVNFYHAAEIKPGHYVNVV